MLGKLTKYEIKATARIFLPLYAGLLLFALINKVFIEINLLQTKMAFLSAISGMIYFFIIVATFIITLVVMIQRFYKNLLSDEGYLMFTIPVTPSKHIISKMIVSILCGRSLASSPLYCRCLFWDIARGFSEISAR